MASENIRAHLRHVVVIEGNTNHVLCGSTVHSFRFSTVLSIRPLSVRSRAALAGYVVCGFCSTSLFILNEAGLEAF